MINKLIHYSLIILCYNMVKGYAMAISEEQKVRVQALLATGKTPKEAAELTGVGYQTILSIRKQGVPKLLDEVKSIEPVTLQIIADAAKDVTIDEAVEGITGLQALDVRFQRVIGAAIDRSEEFIKQEDLKVSELVAITNSLSGAYNNIFNNKGVNVNVNTGMQFSDNKLSMFKGSLRD